jgi:O-antigen/teichoic acid export membrane protein
MLAQAVIAATQVVFARLYGPVIFGSYGSVVALLEVFCRGGVAGADKAMLRYVAAARASGDAAGVRSAIGTGLRMCLAGSGLFFLVLLLGGPWLARLMKEPELGPALRILAPLPLFVGVVWVLIQASLAARVTRANFYVRGLAEPSLLLAGGVLAWTLGSGLLGLVTAHLLAYVVTLALAVLVVRRIFRPEEMHRLLSAPRLPGFARFSVPIALSEALNALVQRAGIFILTSRLGPEAVALYNAAELITRAISNIRYAFDSIVAGVLSETLALGQHDRLKYNLRLATRWVVSVAAPITATVVVLRADLLQLLFSGPYVAGAGLLLTLALSHLVNSSLGLTGWVLMVAGKSHLSLFNNVVCSAFNLVASYFLIGRFGVIGAGYAAVGTSLLMQGLIVAQTIIWQRVHPLSAALLKPLAAAALTFAAQSALHASIGSLGLRLVAVIGAGAALYALLLWGLRLPQEERQIFDRVVGAARARLRL